MLLQEGVFNQCVVMSIDVGSPSILFSRQCMCTDGVHCKPPYILCEFDSTPLLEIDIIKMIRVIVVLYVSIVLWFCCMVGLIVLGTACS